MAMVIEGADYSGVRLSAGQAPGPFYQSPQQPVQDPAVRGTERVEQLLLVAQRQGRNTCVYRLTRTRQTQPGTAPVARIVGAYQVTRREKPLHCATHGHFVHRSALRDFDGRKIRVARP